MRPRDFRNSVLLSPAVLLFTAALSSSADMEQGLVGYYPMEGTGETLRDESGLGNDGKMANATRTPKGRWDWGLLLSPDTGSRIPGSKSMQVDDAFTIAVWVHPKELAEEGRSGILCMDFHFNVALMDGGSHLEVYSDGNWHEVGVGPKLSEGKWQHVAVTFSEEDGGFFYHDGEEVAAAPGPNKMSLGRASIRIGVRTLNQAVVPALDGVLDELRIYMRELDADDVRDIFEFVPRPRPRAVSPLTSLTAAWGALKVR